MSFKSLVIALAVLAPAVLAVPTPVSNTYITPEGPKVTPRSSVPAPPRLHTREVAEARLPHILARSLDTADIGQLLAREVGDTLLGKRAAAAACLDSSATDVDINSALYYGGANTVVKLCAGANLQLTNAIFYTAANQEISTVGYPKDSTRATLTVAGADQSCAIYAACDNCQNIKLRNVQVDGSRPTLGWMGGGIGLLEFGGNTKGQLIDNCHLFEPRGWTALHGIEGYQNSCSGMTISNNQVGPSGNSPNQGYQFRKRDYLNEDLEGISSPAGRWADGISLACKGSTVTRNTVTDATDGGIVIFGAPGSQITKNTIVAKTRHLLGGINAVDFGPFGGPYTGTVVSGNTVNAYTTFIKIGIAIGGMSWGSDNRTASRTFDGTFTGNVIKSGTKTGYFGYGISVAGHNNAYVNSNDATHAYFGGEPSIACITDPAIPSPQAFVYDTWTTTGSNLQGNFVDNPLAFLICTQPGALARKGPSKSYRGGMINVGSTTSVLPSAAEATAPIANSSAVVSGSATTTTVASTTQSKASSKATSVASTATAKAKTTTTKASKKTTTKKTTTKASTKASTKATSVASKAKRGVVAADAGNTYFTTTPVAADVLAAPVFAKAKATAVPASSA